MVLVMNLHVHLTWVVTGILKVIQIVHYIMEMKQHVMGQHDVCGMACEDVQTIVLV